MPDFASILEEIFKRRELVPEEFYKAVLGAERGLIKVLVGALSKLNTENGALVADSRNLAQIEIVSRSMNDALLSGQYRAALEDFVREFPKQAQLVNTYFSKVFPKIFDPEDKFYAALTKNSQKQALELLTDNAIDANFLQPLKRQLTASVTTGATFSETVESLTTFIEGNKEIDGALTRYVKQVAKDAYMVSDRQYTQTISDRLGAEWFLYQGGVVEDSRDFCLKHHGHYFHKKEVEELANGSWQGKMKGTNEKTIFAMAGGYQCMHAFLPVSIAIVPKDVIQRAAEKGFYKAA